MPDERPPSKLPGGVGYHRGGRATWSRETPAERGSGGGDDFGWGKKIAIALVVVAVLTGAWAFFLR